MGEYKQEMAFIAALIVVFVVGFLSFQIVEAREDNVQMQREINRLNVENYTLCVKLGESFCTYTIN